MCRFRHVGMYSIICILAFTDYSFLNTTFYLDLMDEGGGEGKGRGQGATNLILCPRVQNTKVKLRYLKIG